MGMSAIGPARGYCTGRTAKYRTAGPITFAGNIGAQILIEIEREKYDSIVRTKKPSRSHWVGHECT